MTARALLGALALYRTVGSPAVTAMGVRCRFEPSCSRYAAVAVERDGAFVGTLRAAWRVLRCGPWTAAGTLDPP